LQRPNLELLSLLLLLLLWQLTAFLANNRLLPGPIDMARRLWGLTVDGPLLSDFGHTLWRAAIAFVASMILGTVIGLLMGRIRWLDRLFAPWLFVGYNLPAIVIAIALYIWLGLGDVALILAVMCNKMPMVITTVRQGAQNLSPDLDELAVAFRLAPARRLRYVIAPQLLPFVFVAARTGLSLIWKIVLVFEILGSDGGAGFRINIFFQFFDVAGILAYTVVFIVIVLAVEYGLLRPFERQALRWRPDPV